jgi:apolipoprotein N-acyltransferase
LANISVWAFFERRHSPIALPRFARAPAALLATPTDSRCLHGTMFPREVIAAKIAGRLLNLTNAAWYGDTPGPYQHLLQARVRAVEEGLPLVRAANSGISAIVDPHGRVLSSLELGRIGVVDGDLPAALPPTPYGQLGDLVFLAMLLVTASGAALCKIYL